ncbi:alginate O-acetyltransferase AlgX-related protein [Clostridium intestinale]|uniref:alginate O-acetyltransferase AlgX-related protein n=1 Tax=Clostridium intestinale TaxID=36845 RepID=UPI002DD69096|nr:hypothetical protein [Clostridium intestinale]WRY49816.1 hypothetical protein P8F83_13900 [Clostridium intestinale]
MNRDVKRSSVIKVIYIIVIFILMLIPLTGLKKSGGNLESENRRKSEKPKIMKDKSFNSDLGRDTENWVNDNVLFREELSGINSFINIKLFKSSPNEDKVLVGKDNWLFYSGEKSLEFYRNSKLYSEEELLKIKNNLLKHKAYLDNFNCKMILMIPPNKETIYNEYYPDKILKVSSYSKLDQLMDYLSKNTDLEVIDVRDDLMRLKSEKTLYYLTDTHWNNMGGFVGYKKLIKAVNKVYENTPMLSEDDFYINSVNIKTGDLQNMLALNGYFNDLDYEFKPKEQYSYKEVETSNNKELITEIENSDLPKCVMQRDSFTIAMKPFLSNSFSRITYKWEYNFDYSLIEREKPDVFIYSILERYIDNLLNDN